MKKSVAFIRPFFCNSIFLRKQNTHNPILINKFKSIQKGILGLADGFLITKKGPKIGPSKSFYLINLFLNFRKFKFFTF